MNQLSDDILLEFSQGSQRAFRMVFDCFRLRIFYFVKRLIDDSLVADEITSDTFVKLHRLRENFKTHLNIQAFLYITARNASLDYLKYRQRQQQNMTDYTNQGDPEISFPLFAETTIEAELLQYIYNEIEKLPERVKQVFKLSYFEGLSNTEIAEKLKTAPQTVSNQKHAALKFLRMRVLDRTGILLNLLCIIKEVI